MSFESWAFLGLLTAAFAAYWTVPHRARAAVLAVASVVFYAWPFPAHAALMLAVSALVLGVSRLLEHAEEPRVRKWLLALGVAGVALPVLAFFKYAAMAAGTANPLLVRFGLAALPIPKLAAPLGISFVSFGLVHFLVEVYRGDVRRPNPVEFAAYVLFFPTVTAGPIKRYGQFMNDLRQPRGPARDEIAYGAMRILIGLFKKLVIADSIAGLAVPLHAPVGQNALAMLFGIYAFTFQIYYDFAGYSDIAIGAARLFGFRIAENFDRPYLRRNISEFWRAWHMSLSRLITEYVYIPLGGSRKGRGRTAVNALAAMAVSGLWHGAAWHFVAWGLWHGVGLAVVRWWREATRWLRGRLPALEAVASSRVGEALSHGGGVLLTFNFVAFGWVLFVLPVDQAWHVYRSVFLYAVHFVGRAVT